MAIWISALPSLRSFLKATEILPSLKYGTDVGCVSSFMETSPFRVLRIFPLELEVKKRDVQMFAALFGLESVTGTSVSINIRLCEKCNPRRMRF